MTALTAEKGWRMDIGPINIRTERSSAGEGVMWRLGNIKVQVVKLAAQHAKDMDSIGRLGKYVIQYALGYPFTVHNIHAWTNGATDVAANAKTNELLDVIDADARAIKDRLNGEPKHFEKTRALSSTAQLHDVGDMKTKAGRSATPMDPRTGPAGTSC